MVQHTPGERRPWEDRFNQPTVADLQTSLPGKDALLFEEATRELDEILGDRHDVVWRGVCWKWTVLWNSREASDFAAAVIPNPEDLQVAIRLDPEFVQQASNRRLKRSVRDGLLLAADPFDTELAIWTINSQPMLREVLTLLRDQAAYIEADS